MCSPSKKARAEVKKVLMEERVRKCGSENLKVLIQGVRIQLFVLTHEIYLPLDRNLHRQTLADEKTVLQHQIGVEGVRLLSCWGHKFGLVMYCD